MATQRPGTSFLRLYQILEFFPISKSAWWKGCATERYPKPLKLGPRTTVWRAEEIKSFIEFAGKDKSHEWCPVIFPGYSLAEWSCV